MGWMAWTLPTAIFFIAVAGMLVGMTVWEALRPNIARRGLLPIVTTRGDRLFIGLLGSAFIHVGWLAITDWSVWIASAVCVAFIAAAVRWA